MKQIFVDGNHLYDYDLLEGKIYTLYYAKSDSWSSNYAGEIAFQIENDGNGYKILTELEKKKRLNYSEAEYLYILLKLADSESTFEIGTKIPL